jgi:ribosomal protein S18 acetylase RimI-like enzyme
MRSLRPRKEISPDPVISIDITENLSASDLNDLCDITEESIEAGGGFGWVNIPSPEILERYWNGVMLVPERHLLLARMDGAVCGAVQLVEPTRHNEAQQFSVSLLASFIAPWARGYGAGRRLLETAETLARDLGYKMIQLDVRETQNEAITLYENMGYKRWGTNPAYALVNGRMIAGHYYTKTISPMFIPKSID